MVLQNSRSAAFGDLDLEVIESLLPWLQAHSIIRGNMCPVFQRENARDDRHCRGVCDTENIGATFGDHLLHSPKLKL